MSVRALGIADQQTWHEIARLCPYATYYHTPAWADLMAWAHPQLSVASRLFRLTDGGLAVLPLVRYRARDVFYGYESMVPGVYGGPIAERVLLPEEVDAILDRAVTPLTSRLRVYGNPYLEHFRAAPETADEFTHWVDLRDGFDAAHARFHKNHRQTHRQAIERGLELDRAQSLDDFREYFAVYQTSRRRWGETARTDDPLALFEEVHRRADPNVVLWLARFEGRVVGGELWLYWNQTNVGWHGAADPAFFKKFPANFLLTEIMRDASNRGFRFFDLAPSPGTPGLVQFKDYFRAERIYFRHADRGGSRVYDWRRQVDRQWSRIRSRLAMPLPGRVEK